MLILSQIKHRELIVFAYMQNKKVNGGLPAHLRFSIHLSEQLLGRESRQLNQRRPFCLKKNFVYWFL